MQNFLCLCFLPIVFCLWFYLPGCLLASCSYCVDYVLPTHLHVPLVIYHLPPTDLVPWVPQTEREEIGGVQAAGGQTDTNGCHAVQQTTDNVWQIPHYFPCLTWMVWELLMGGLDAIFLL